MKYKALMAARFQLQKTWDRIDYTIDVVDPGVKALEQNAAQGELPEFVLEDEEDA